MLYDAIILGAGPAGQQAGLFLGRANVKTAVIGEPKKSDLAYGKVIGNFFGVSDEPMGLDLLLNGVEHLKRSGVETIEEEVIDLRKQGKKFIVTTASMKTFETKTVVIASGRQLPTAGIKGEKTFLGKGVHTCTACDGPLFKGKRVIVVGSGPHAAEEALELAEYAASVRIVNQGRDWEFGPELRSRLTEKGIALEEKKLASIEGSQLVEYVAYKDGAKEPIDGVFIAIGSAGGVTFAYKLGLEQENGFLKIDRDGKTSLPNVWAAGGCTGGSPQIAKSVGEGCNAAISIIRALKGLDDYKDQT